MYAVLLIVHSWVRWAVVISTLVLFLYSLHGWMRNAPYGATHQTAAKAFIGSIDLQVLLGIVLYALSPLVRDAWSDPGAAMASAPQRFFMIEHQFAALLTFVLAHWGMARARRAPSVRPRHRTTALVSGCALVFLVTVIPWPALPYGRALFRL